MTTVETLRNAGMLIQAYKVTHKTMSVEKAELINNTISGLNAEISRLTDEQPSANEAARQVAQETARMSDGMSLASLFSPDAVDLLKRCEAFMTSYNDHFTAEGGTSLLHDLRAALGMLKPFTVVAFVPGTSDEPVYHPVAKVMAVDTSNAWFTARREFIEGAQCVAVFPGHLKEE